MFIKLNLIGFIIGILLRCNTNVNAALQGYYGTKIGDLSELHHAVSGSVYAVDSRTLFLKNFNYDGEGPAAYFYVGNTRAPSNQGAHRLRDERGSTGVLKRYRNKDITLSLPEGKTLRDIKWFSIWCDDFAVNFGDVVINKNLEFPRPTKISSLSGVHDVSSDNIVIVDAQTLLIPNFSYDGEAPDAKFWVGRGIKPSPNGLRIPDENGKETPLRRYDKKTIVLTLPGDLTVFDIGHFGIWCEAFTVDFGHVRVPDQINVPPSLKMLGISPQSKLNCEVLYDDLAFEVRWAVAGESVVIQLVAKLEDGEYMSFGVSPDVSKSIMVGADVAVTWVDKATGKGYAQDYYLDAKSQCSGIRGSCPDTRFNENSNSIRLLNAAMVNGYSIVTYQRPLRSSDQFDLPIFTNESQAIIWAVGPLNQRYEVSYHSQFLKKNKLIDFGRQPLWNCPTPDADSKHTSHSDSNNFGNGNPQSQKLSSSNRRQGSGNNRNNERVDRPRPKATPRPAAKNGAWDIPPIQCYEPEDGVFYAQMGPTGGKQGYPAITGHVGWGISWYINGLLIPEINVVRGRTYTFVTEGGLDPEVPAKYHPFYITDDSVGGYQHQSEEEQQNIKIFAGAHRSKNGKVTPIGVGRLCNWTPNADGPSADAYPSFGAYQRSLTLKCDVGEPGIITWTPDDDTPDTVYYQCFTHRYLGWRINVLDSCDETPEASEIDEVFVDPEEPIIAEASIRHESKLLPNENFLQQHDKDLIKHHNMNGTPPKVQFELQKNPEMTQIIADGIRAAEELEESVKNKTMTENLSSNSNPSASENQNDFGLMLPSLQDMKYPQSRPVLSGPGLPVYLRPPHNAPMFRPVKLPMRRPISMERRPMSRPPRPFILPQPSMIVSHYQKPMSVFMRPFLKHKTVPIKSIASVLLLGEPTEIKPFKKQSDLIIGKPQKQGSYVLPELPLNYNIKKAEQTVMPHPMRYTKRPYKESYKTSPKVTFKPQYDPSENKSPSKISQISGFQPSSVIVESGFKPIYRRQDEGEAEYEDDSQTFQRRQDDNFSADIDEAIEGDTIFISQETQNQSFEPMFIPSPLDSIALAQTKDKGEFSEAMPNRRIEHLTGDLKDMMVEEGEDKMAVANDRADAYYLPPDTRNVVSIYPEGSVVSYDGKAVLDTSLLNAPANQISRKDYSVSSKTEQFIRETPQFGPFRGEIPPISDYLAPDTPPVFTTKDRPPTPVSEYANPISIDNEKPISTKLSILKTDKSEQSRSKRAAHHHPDHQGDSHDDGWKEPIATGKSSHNSYSSYLLLVLNLIIFTRQI